MWFFVYHLVALEEGVACEVGRTRAHGRVVTSTTLCLYCTRRFLTYWDAHTIQVIADFVVGAVFI